MRIRNSIKLKSYKLSYIFGNDSCNKLKNNLLYQNLNSNYDLQKKVRQKYKNSTNLTEIKEIIPNNNKILFTKSKSKLPGNIRNLTDIKGKYDYIIKNNSQNNMIKSKIKMSNLLIKDFINNKSIPNQKYKIKVNNTLINYLYFFIQKNFILI